MADIESRVDKLEEKYSNLHTVVNVIANKVDNLVDEIKDFKQEMREQNKIRAEEVKMLDSKLENLGNQTRNLTVASMVGIAAIAVSSISIAVAVIYTILK